MTRYGVLQKLTGSMSDTKKPAPKGGPLAVTAQGIIPVSLDDGLRVSEIASGPADLYTPAPGSAA